MGSEGEEEGEEEEREVGCGCVERRVVGSHGEAMVLCFGFRDLESVSIENLTGRDSGMMTSRRTYPALRNVSDIG